MMMKKMILLLCMIFTFQVSIALAEASKSYSIAVADPEESEQGVVSKAFAEYVAEKTNNKINITCFFSSALGDDSESFRNVQKGSLAFAAGGIANLVPFEKKLGILTLPYLFNDIDEVVEGTTGKPAEILSEVARKAGFRVLAWAYSDFRYISNSIRPITKLEHMKGLKFRVPQSAVLIETYEAFGGSPTPISWSETFTALQQGVIDGQCMGYIPFKSMKFHEARQKYITEVHYTYQLQPLLMSERVFQSMDKKTQKLMIKAGEYAQNVVLDYELREAQESKKYLIDQGVVVLQLEDEDKWIKIAKEKVWPKVADFVGGKDFINEYLKACKKPVWNN